MIFLPRTRHRIVCVPEMYLIVMPRTSLAEINTTPLIGPSFLTAAAVFRRDRLEDSKHAQRSSIHQIRTQLMNTV